MVVPEGKTIEPLFNHIGYHTRLDIMGPDWRSMITVEWNKDWKWLGHSVDRFERWGGACVY